eukprot:514706_1
MEEEFTLHYSLTQNETQFIDKENNDSNETVDTNDTSNDETKVNQQTEPSGDDYFDPFDVQDNHKKFGQITLEQLSQTQEIDDDDNDDYGGEDDDIQIASNTKEKDKENTDPRAANQIETDHTKDTLHHDIYCDDDDDEDDMEEDDDEDLRKEMEANFSKANKEKNQNMIHLLQSIRNKHQKQNNVKPKRKKNDNIPSIKPFVNDGNLKIVFTSAPNHIKDKEKQAQKQHYHPINGLKTRKKMKRDLRKKLNRKRKKEIKKYRKEFGKEEDYYDDTEHKTRKRDLMDMEQEQSSDQAENIEDVIPIKKHVKGKENSNEQKDPMEENEDSDVEEMDASEYIDNIVERGDELDEEDLARAALMRKPEVISSEVRDLMDIAAEEEDENGQVVAEKYEDEYEEKFGIAKDLLAEKSEINMIKQHEEVYRAKRNEMYQLLQNREDEEALELMKKAFVDGKYRALQNKAKNKNKYLGLLDEATNDGENALRFKSRHAESNLIRNEPHYYLSDDEEKNEYCCYDKMGRFLDVNTIRMKIMEWNRNKNGEHMMQEDDEEDPEVIRQRKERVRRREALNAARSNSVDNMSNAKISCDDESAIKILQRLRNKKRRKKPKMNKASTTMGINFSAFYMEKGLPIPELQRTHSGSFLKHRNKCIERVKMAAESRSNAGGGSRKHVVFMQKSKSKKRKRDGSDNMKNSNISKKRRIK